MMKIISPRYRYLQIVIVFLLTSCVPWRVQLENVPANPGKTSTPTTITNTKTAKPTSNSVESSALLLPNRLIIAYLDAGYLVFECLDVECIKKFELSKAISLVSPYQLESAYIISPTSIYVQLYSLSTHQRALLSIKVDGEVKEITIPDNASQGIIAHGRLILQDSSNNTIYIIQDDLTVKTVELEAEISQLIEADDENVLALNRQPLNQNGKTLIEVIQLNVSTGDKKQLLVNCPPFSDPLLLPGGRSSDDRLAGVLLTISTDLKFVYMFYNSEIGDEGLTQTLGVFDTESLEEVNSIKNPSFLTLLTESRFAIFQYRNWSYPRVAFTNTEGINQGLHTPFNLNSLEPLMDVHEILKKEYIKTVTYVPFGDYYSIGSSTRVILVSLDGKIYKEYPLPLDRIQVASGDRGYSIVENHSDW